MKIVDESILFFSRVFLLKFSLEVLTFHGYKGIYSRVYEECEESVTTKQGILVTRAHDSNSRLVLVESSSCQNDLFGCN